MKRRVDDVDVVAPAELINYRLWCRSRGLKPYGIPDNTESMRGAAAQWYAWERLRAEWAVARGVDEMDLPTSGCGAPFDPDLI